MIKLDLPVLLDTFSDTFSAWQVKTLPTSYLIDAAGTVRYRVIGNPGWDSAKTSGIIDTLLTEVLTTTTE